jgi:hypothetical protein
MCVGIILPRHAKEDSQIIGGVKRHLLTIYENNSSRDLMKNNSSRVQAEIMANFNCED